MKKREGRILLVDDDQEWLNELEETLQQGGFYVEMASTIEEARCKLAAALFHLVILDIRMQNNDQANKAGIDLLLEMRRSALSRAIKVVVLSAHAYESPRYMRTAFMEDAVDVVDKYDFDNVEFLQRVRGIFEQHVNVNFLLEVTWQMGLSLKKVAYDLTIEGKDIEEQPVLQGAMQIELDDLLCRLFYKAHHVLVSRVTAGHSGTGVLFVRPVFEAGAARAHVVKYGDTHKIEREYERYKLYAEPYIGGGHNTAAFDVAYTSRLGGIVYALLGVSGNRLEDFGEFYAHSSREKIKSMLERLFKTICGAWYANPGRQVVLNLSETYPQQLHFTWEKLNSRLADLSNSVQVQGKEMLTFSALTDSQRQFINPIMATDPLTTMEVEQRLVYMTYCSSTHGDFNQHNILIDSNGDSWLIDFQETGPAHILRDIVALDTEIRCKLLRSDEATLDELLEMEEALCRVQRFSQLNHLSADFQSSNPAIAKIYYLVVYLRRLAYELTPNNDDSMDEYYAALLYNALNTSRFRTLTIRQREHALISASLLVKKLGL